MHGTLATSAIAFASLAAANPVRRDIFADKCTTGTLQCCNSIHKAGSTTVSTLFGLLGIVVPDPNVLVGLTCSPISVIGVSGTSCSAQPVCCTGNSFSGLVVVGCTPVNINL